MALNIERSCLNKNRYATKEAAQRAFRDFKEGNRGKKGARMNIKKLQQIPYKCDNCNGWHLKSI